MAAWIGLAVAGWRIAILVAASFVSFGAFGYWSDSMDSLIITFVSVAVVVVVGIPHGGARSGPRDARPQP